MKYKKHTINLFPPELCISLCDCPKDFLEYNDNHNKETCIGIIYGEQVNKKIFMTWEGRNKNYKILKFILDDCLGDKK